MNSNLTFAVSFFLRSERVDKDGTAPVFMRVTVNGEKADFTLNRRLSINKWKNGKPFGTSEEVKQIKDHMEMLRNKIYSIQKELKDQYDAITIEMIREAYYGKNKNVNKGKGLKEVFELHNENIKALVGKGFSNTTAKRYDTTKKHVFDYLELKHKRQDIYLSELKYDFITGLESYLKIERNCNHNSTMKYIKNFRKVINMAINNEWLERDPFGKFKSNILPVKREFLTIEELQAIENKEIDMPRTEQVRDVFVFCCYTGLAYVDVTKLKKENIYKGIDGSQWINIDRTKTDTNSKIPLLPKAKEILDKYKNHPIVVSGKSILPTSSNQKMNSYLKDIAERCGITKNLTFHIARHTFATTVTLTNGVPIESVSFMLGHKSIKTTQIYSKVVETKVGHDMQELMKKFSSDNQESKERK